ncbi:nuclear factor 7, brain-like [Eublepharis macularius]|uniref:Nuclear factor 7, brain-like n=1 Tax=Eublepharis macularius TaxID=481883 RepID=A0AA97J7D7_EUBMA|nr:nuclear factor 7, brain-like [Eublepharis macularius]
MASGLAEDLVCPICLALFQEPHMLACGHNFCLACLQSVVPGGQEAGTCPECRGPFQMAELKRNRALGSLARKVRRWKADEEPLPGAPAGPWHFCEEHDEPLKLFCTEDEGPICVICRDLPQHRGHEFLPTKNAVLVSQGKLKAYLKHLEKHLKEVVEDEKDQQNEIAALKNCTEDLLGLISSGFKDLHQILHKKEQEIRLMVEKMNEENMEEMEASLTSLKEEGTSQTETIAKVKAALETTDHIAFLKGFKKLIEQVKEIHQGEIEDDEEDEEKPDDQAEEKSNNAECGEDQWEDADGEEDNEDYEPDESDHDDDDDRVIPVELALESFGESLDFELWKEQLESIKPKEII